MPRPRPPSGRPPSLTPRLRRVAPLPSLLSFIACLALALAGCSDDPSRADEPDATTDATPHASEDVAPDAVDDADDATDDDAASDADDADVAPVVCAFPPAVIGGTPETDALAQAPARCGQAPHAWIDDPRLGEVVEQTFKLDVPRPLIEGVVAEAGITLPRPLEHDARIFQLRYMTQDRGALIEATAMVAAPRELEADAPVDVLLLLHGTTGFMDDCAPSNSLEGQGLAALFASWGYLVIAPDYIGLKGAGEPSPSLHPYLVGQATAIASLDAVRALSRLSPGARGDLCPAPRVLVFGGSQGGHAALWVDRLAPYYARELTLLGAVATVPPADLVTQGERALSAPVPATGNFLAMLGAAAPWYGLDGRLDEVLVPPYDAQVPEALAASCNPGDAVDAPDDLATVFQPPLLDAAANGALADFGDWGCLLAENSLVDTSIPRLPDAVDTYGVLFITGAEDALVNTPIERASVPALCAQGADVAYLECAGAEHVPASFWSMGETLDFLEARAAGLPLDPARTCAVGPAVTCASTPP